MKKNIQKKRVVKKIYFIGAGPVIQSSITLKGRKLLDRADVVVYAGSLVNPALLKGTKAELYNSAAMTIDEVIEVMRSSNRIGQDNGTAAYG